MITSWTSECCSWKSSCNLRRCLAQQPIEPTAHLSRHFIKRPSVQRPCSWSTCFMPFSWSGNSGWPTEKIIGCTTFWSFCINHPSLIRACFPPGRKFIREARRASVEYAEWPCELSIKKRAWYPGPWTASKVGMIFSCNCGGKWLKKDCMIFLGIPVSQTILRSSSHHSSYHIQGAGLQLQATPSLNRSHHFDGSPAQHPSSSTQVHSRAPNSFFSHHSPGLWTRHETPRQGGTQRSFGPVSPSPSPSQRPPPHTPQPVDDAPLSVGWRPSGGIPPHLAACTHQSTTLSDAR